MVHIPERRKTVRSKGEKTQRRSEQKYRDILENMEEGYYEEDLAGNFTFFNNSMCRIYGYSREELMGMNYRQYTDKETAKKLFQIFNEIYKTGNTNISYNYEVIGKDGAKRYIEASASIRKDSSDKPIGFKGIIRDVTSRREAEEALRRSEEKYRTVVELSPDGIAIASKGRHVFANKSLAKIFGVSGPDELVGKPIIDYIHPDYRKTVLKRIAEQTKRGALVPLIEEKMLRADGAVINTEVAAAPLEYEGEQAVLAVIRDITDRKQTEEALSKSERFLTNIFNSIRDGISIIDKSMNIVRVNSVMEQWYAYNMPLVGKKCYKAYHSRDERCKTCPTWQTLQTGESAYAIVPKRGAGDTIVGWLDLYSFPIVDDATGEMQGVIEYVRDVTEHKLAEEALRGSEEKYRSILESIREGYFELNLDGNYTFANEASCRYLGYTKEELIGMNYRRHMDEETAKKMYQSYYELYRTGNPIEILELEAIRKDATKAIYETSVSLIRDNEGKPVGFRGVSRDITERKKMEEALRRSEEKYRHILENMEEGCFEIDLVGNFTFVNNAECRNLGYSKEELIGMNNRQYQDEATVRRMYQIFNDIYKTGEPNKIIDIEIIRKDETKKFNEISVALIRDSQGKKIGFSGVSRDITERKRADDALKRNREELIRKNQEIEESRKNVQLTLEKLAAAYEELKTSQAKILQQEKMASIGQLAAGVAHEINNPMAFIASNLGTLDKYIRRLKDFIQAQSETIKSLKAIEAIEKLDKKRKELKLDYTIDDIDLLVKESRDGSERVQKIVQELNRFSRMDNAEYKEANINECMESSINIVWNELKQKATLHKDYGNLPQTKCYPLKLNQVFINLLINAIHAIEKKGKIKIKTWEKGGSIWVTVSDTGCGIPRENQSKIFEPFFTTKEVGKGTGLGLNISYEIIQRHKGEISFESKKGKGTTFTIRMPIV